jgi:hypothetical protein
MRMPALRMRSKAKWTTAVLAFLLLKGFSPCRIHLETESSLVGSFCYGRCNIFRVTATRSVRVSASAG